MKLQYIANDEPFRKNLAGASEVGAYMEIEPYV